MSKLYVGERSAKVLATVTVNGELLSLKRSQKVRNHSPRGYGWGYSGSGPAQLALAILLDVTDDPAVAQQHYQAFKRQYVANWGDRWELTDREVREWLALGQTQVN